MCEADKTDGAYLIRKGVSFYRPNCQGYTDHLEAAGIFPYDTARREADARPNEVYITPLRAFEHEIATAHALLNEKRVALGMAEPPDDSDIKLIEDRHDMDARWFKPGTHDPNGYVAMAHKDRGVLLERLRMDRERITEESVRMWMVVNGFGHMLAAAEPLKGAA